MHRGCGVGVGRGRIWGGCAGGYARWSARLGAHRVGQRRPGDVANEGVAVHLVAVEILAAGEVPQEELLVEARAAEVPAVGRPASHRHLLGVLPLQLRLRNPRLPRQHVHACRVGHRQALPRRVPRDAQLLRGAQAILRHLARHLQRLDALGLVADVPDLHRTVGAARGEVLALRVEGDTEDRVCVAADRKVLRELGIFR